MTESNAGPAGAGMRDRFAPNTQITVGHILPFRGGVGGAELATLRLAEAAGRAGIPSVMFSAVNAVVEEFFRSHGFRVVAFEPEEPSYRHPGKYWRASRDLARQFRKEGVGLVHCADVLGAHYASLAALLARKKLICHVRNRHDRISRRDLTFLAPVDGFVFVSRHTWDTFSLRTPDRKGAVLYDGIDLPEEISEMERRDVAARVRREFGIPPGRRLAGMVARVAPQKDYVTLCRAAQLVVKTHDVSFLIVGDYEGPVYRETYEQTRRLLEELGISDRFVFSGFRRDARMLMAGMDVCVLSTHYEGFPLVLLESMADGRPVAATAVDGIPEIVIDEQTGLLHPHGDYERLAVNLRRLFEDAELAKRLGAAGRDLVRSRFSQEQFERNVVEMYRRWM
jgi:glycosyltransferase involved in cell wall biosynthesis